MTARSIADELETRRARAILDRDWKALGGMLSDDLYFAHSSGLIDDKKTLLDKFEMGKIRYLSLQNNLTGARLLTDNVLQATGLLTLVAELNGENKTISAIYMVVWSRDDDGQWRLAAHQSTARPQ